MPESIELEIGPYRVESTISKTGSAVVFKATDPATGRPVAIKVAGSRLKENPEAVRRFLADGELARGLSHPHITRCLETGKHGEDPYHVLEYVPGTSLDKVLAARRVSLQEALQVVKGIAQGLGAAHRQGILHGNLKPRNVLVTDDFSTVKITDFGTSRLEGIKVGGETLSTGQMSVGTVHYASPEVAHSQPGIDQRADLFSLGVIFYELLTGRSPSGRINLPSQLVAGLPTELDPIVLKCLAQDKGQRYASTEAFLADIGHLEQERQLRLAAELEGISRTTRKLLGSSPASETTSRRPPYLLVGGGLAALIVLGLVAFIVVNRGPAPAPAPAAEPPGATPPAPPAAEPVAPAAAAPEPTVQAAPKPAPASPKPATSEPVVKASPTAKEPAPPPPVAPTEKPSPAANEAAKALYQQAQALLTNRRRDESAEARKLLTDLLTQYPDSSYAVPALVQRAVIEEQKRIRQTDPVLGKTAPAALATYRTLTERYGTAAAAEEALWKMGVIYEDESRFDLAAQTFSDLGTRFPKTRYEAWYRAGTLFEKKLKDPARAKQAYGQVPAGSSRYNDAQDRLKKL